MILENRKVKDILKALTLPLIFLVVFISLAVFWKVFQLPPEEELISLAQRYFELYGNWVIFASAIIEGVLLLGWYYPGSFIIFLGVNFALGDVFRIGTIVILVSIAFFFAYFINYLLGKHGWYKLFLRFGLKKPIAGAQERLNKHGSTAIILSYCEPNLASLTATAAGILHFPLKKFLIYSLFAIFAWNIIWATVIYFLGEVALELVGIKFIFIVLALWILFIVIKQIISILRK